MKSGYGQDEQPAQVIGFLSVTWSDMELLIKVCKSDIDNLNITF